MGGDGNHHGKDAERIINTNAPANGEKFRLPGRCFYFIGLADRIVIVQLCQFLLVFLQRLGGFRILYLGAFLIAVVLNVLLVQPVVLDSGDEVIVTVGGLRLVRHLTGIDLDFFQVVALGEIVLCDVLRVHVTAVDEKADLVF